MHWPGELRRLPDHEVYALDLPGTGAPAAKVGADIGAYAEVVREFADALKLPAFVLGGHSMGGAIALEFALRYGGRLAGLILVGTGARLRVAPEILAGMQNDIEGTTALLAAWAHGTHVSRTCNGSTCGGCGRSIPRCSPPTSWPVTHSTVAPMSPPSRRPR